MQKNQRSNCQHPLDHWNSKRVPEKHSLLLYCLCWSLWLCGSKKLWKILQEMGIPDHLTCLLRNMYESESEVAQSCLTLYDPMDCSLPGSSVHGIFQAIVMEWIAISFSRGSSQPRNWTWVSHRRLTIWATREVREICIQVKNQQLKLDMEQQTGSKLGKEYIKAVYCHPAYIA